MLQPAQPRPSSPRELDAMVERVREGAARFARLSLRERIALLEDIRNRYFAVLDDAIAAGCNAKGLRPDTEEAGEEWFAHAFCVVRHFRLTLESLRQIESAGAPNLESGWMRDRPSGGLAVRVYPTSRLDGIAFPGIRAEIYAQQGIDRRTLRERQAPFYRSPHGGRVALVLGAGNVPSIPPRDVLTKMFNEGKACILKMNPVNEYLGPFLERAFQPAIERGFMALAYGGADAGGYLTHHRLVDEVHITGSDKTHDAIVWGPPGPEREARRQRGEPLLTKEITSELGNVSPVIVVPGPWEAGDFDLQGRNIAGMVANNASFNCNAARLIVQPKGWSGRKPLVDAVERALANVRPRHAYYPGAHERYRQFVAGRDQLSEIGRARPGELPWAVIRDVDPADSGERCFSTEAWCSVLAETAIASPDPVAFLDAAVRFVNERVWGTLNATLLVHPRTAADPRFAAALEEAIERLRYGTVAINLWPAAGFTMGTTPWGAHPSSTLEDIQSGRGWIANTLMIEGIEKVVIRAPFRMNPKPVWFPDHRSLATLGRRVTELEKEGSWLRLPKVALAALRG